MKSLLTIILLTGSFGMASAVTPIIWKQDTQDVFSKGDAASVSITRDGEVRLGPVLSEFADTGEEFVWSIARDNQNRVYAGTGGEGRVYRLSEGSSELLLDSPERAIFSLTVGGNGTVYAGSSPGGLIYAIPRDGEPKTFARTEDEHVWVLISDGSGGLYAATGGRAGRVLRISKSGDVTEILKTGDPNISSLIRSSDGTLYAGTDENGLIYRISPSGSTNILYDASEDEIKALAIGSDGRLIAGAMNSTRPSPQRPPAAQANSPGVQGPSGRSVIYAIQPSGSGWRLWDVPSPSVHALSVSDDGSVTILTGGDGDVFRLYPDGSHSVMATVDEAKPWAFVGDGEGGGWIASSGGGKVFRLGSTPAHKGSLTSEPEDFLFITRWGRVGWKGDAPSGSSVSLEARSGNSERPDETWGEWSAVSAGGVLSVLPARYIQYRLNLEGDGKMSPAVREVTVSGLPENVQPMILDLGVRGPHEEQTSGSTGHGGKNGSGRSPSPKGENASSGWTITWTGADVNNDVLVYALHFKGRTEKEWKLLEDNIKGNSYAWETDSAPEGVTQVRLTVSDSPSNPANLARSSQRISEPFEIDHTEPVVGITSIESKGKGQVAVTGSATDATSYIKSAAYSVNSGDWNVLFPVDEIFDSGEEAIVLLLDNLAAGEYTLVIRATDSRGNVGVAKRVFDVK